MKTRISTIAAVVGLLVAVCATDLLAAGRGNCGGNGGQQNGPCVNQQGGIGATAVTRPAGSRRRDGTFLSTGVTANGSTTRAGRGNGLQDGSCLKTTPAPAQ